MNQRTALPPPFPADWTKTPLGSIADIRTGDKDNQDKQSHGKYPFFVRSPHVERINSYSYDGEAILVPGEGNIGEIFHYINGPFDFHQRVYKISHFPPGVHGRFLYHYLSHYFGRHALRNSVKATVDSLRRPTFETFEVYLPDISEQQLIASALDDVGRLVVSLDELIGKKKHVRIGVRQALLSRALRLPGFSSAWSIAYIEDVATVDPETLPTATDADYEFRYIAIESVERGRLVGHTRQRFGTAPSRARRKVASGDVLFGTVRPNLQSHLLFLDDADDWVASTGFAVIRANFKELDASFLFHSLFSDEITKQILALIAGSNYPAVSSGDVRRLQLSLPPLSEQQAIAEVLSDMDAEIDALVAQRDKTAQLKQAMMQELLTGRTRLS